MWMTVLLVWCDLNPKIGLFGAADADRFDRLAQTASTFEWFDPANQQHLQRVFTGFS